MTVTTSTTGKVTYLGDGASVIFPYPYYFLDQNHLRVLKRAVGGTDTVLTLGVDYTVTGALNPAGGSVVATVAPVAGEQVMIKRAIPLTQEVDYLANDSFPAESHEQALDKLTMALQSGSEDLARALRLGETDTDGAGSYRANGNRIVNLPTPLDLTDAANREYVDNKVLSAVIGTTVLQPFAMELLRDAIGTWNGARTVLTIGPYDLQYSALFVDGVLQSELAGDYVLVHLGGFVYTYTFPIAVPVGSVVYIIFITGQTLRVLPADVGNTTAQWNANKLQGRDIAATAPTDGFVLTWNAGANRWEPKTPGSGGGGGVTLGGTNTWTGVNTFANDVLMSGNARRFTADFTNGTLGNRWYAQSSAPGGTTEFGLLPNATGTDSAFVANASPDPNNSSIGRFTAGSRVAVQSYKTGAGLVRPLDLEVNGFIGLRVNESTRNVGIGTVTDNGTKLNINGTLTVNGCAFRATRNGTPYNVADATFTKVTFSTEEFDQSGHFDLGTSKFLPTIPGKYVVIFGAHVLDGQAIANKRMIVAVYKNGVLYRESMNTHTSSIMACGSSGSAVVDMNGTTDYLEFYVWHNFGVTVQFAGFPLDCFVEGYRIG